MTLYESNHIRLGWLLPSLPAEGSHLVSRVSDDCPLHLTVGERCRYTTTLMLTYLFREGEEWIADPDLRIRIYHDARMVEAMQCTDRHRHRALRAFATGEGSELQRRWARNTMLNKWLEFCADQGHHFSSPNGAEL